MNHLTAEHQRLEEARDRKSHWKRWGPYLSERAWGTVREDYSEHGTAWEYVAHDHARGRLDGAVASPGRSAAPPGGTSARRA